MKKLMIFALAAVMMLSACGKKESTPTGPTVPTDAPRYKTHTITLPAKMSSSSDSRAQTVVFYMGMANSLSASLSGYFLPPSLNKTLELQGDGPWQYSWTDGEVTVNVHIKAVGERYVWEVYYTGKKNDFTVNNWLGVRAEQSKNERNGNFTSFLPPGNAVAATFIWALDAANALTFEVVAAQFMAGSRFVGTINADQSGVLEVYQLSGSVYGLAQKYQWNQEGAGQWWEYDNGTVTANGSWE